MNTFDPKSKEPFKISRYRIENFMRCKCCFWLEMRLGVKQPQPPPYSLNLAVDHLLKKEFDSYREKGERHPLMERFGILGFPYSHRELTAWRTNAKGMRALHQDTDMLVVGAPDDIWVTYNTNYRGALSVVDYKSTSTSQKRPVGDPYWISYKRQIEIYEWLLKKQDVGYEVSTVGYFIFANAKKNQPGFNAVLKFDMEILSFVGDTSWVEPALHDIKFCLLGATPPKPNSDCEWCRYRSLAKI